MSSRPKVKVNLDNLQFLGRAQEFLDTYDFPADLVEDVVRRPDSREKDPYSDEAGYLVVRCRRGDITVAMGLRDPEHPTVMYVYLHTPEDHAQGSATSGGGSGSKLPSSGTALRGMLQKEGCRLSYNGRGHFNVYYGDVLLGGIASTGSSRNTKNDYMFIRRRLTAEKAKKELRERAGA